MFIFFIYPPTPTNKPNLCSDFDMCLNQLLSFGSTNLMTICQFWRLTDKVPDPTNFESWNKTEIFIFKRTSSKICPTQK